jgi:hypothetical protein
MATGRPRTLALCLTLAALGSPGCSSPGPLTSRQTMVGSLKASVSQLEYENQKLKKEVGELKADNSRIDNQLVQEREANGEIAARLDDAKDLLRRQGGNVQAMGNSLKNFEDDGIPPPVAAPKGRKVNNKRPSPTVRIPSPEFAPSPSADDDLSYEPPGRRPRDIGSIDREEEDRWLPVARGLPSQIRQ